MSGRITDPSFDRIYNREWFMGHHSLRAEYFAVADALDAEFQRVDCLDIGCGMAFVIQRLQFLGWDAYGCDGSQHAIDLAPKSVKTRIDRCDLTEPATGDDDFYLVICTEVAEHLEARYAPTLVDRIVKSKCADGWIFFTAATPGQGGNDHVNEQPHEYWIRMFEARGQTLDTKKTLRLRHRLGQRCPGMHWYGKNAMVFR